MKFIVVLLLTINLLYAGLITEGLSFFKKLSITGGAGVSIASDSDKYTIENITLQPKWHEQFQFAGYYMAKHKGFYRDVGLNVTIKPYENDIESISDMVVDKDSNTTYGIAGSSLILDMLKHKNIVLLKAVLQESPVIVLSLKRNTLDNSKNKRMMISKNEFKNVVFQSILNKNHADIKHSFQLIYKMAFIEDLIKEKTDFMIAYKTNEPFVLQSKGYKEEDYNIYSAEDIGMKFYADILFTSKRELKEHPDRVKRFVDASIKGWRVAFADINKTAKFIYENYNKHNKSLEALIFEGNELRKMAIKRDGYFGNISALRLKEMEQYYSDRGLIDNSLSLNEYEDYIYKEWYEKNKKNIESIVLSLILVLVVIFVLFLIFFNFRLKKEVKRGIERYKDLKKVQKLEKQKMMEIDIINATHQLKSPLNTIASIIDNLKRDSRDNNFSQEVLEVALSKIEGQSSSMKETVDYFLGFTRNKKTEPFSVNEILEQSLQYFDEKFMGNNIEVIVNKDEYQDFICLGEKQQLTQVFHVLFDNAIDVLIECKSNRKIITTLKESDDSNHILITVADNGRGIPKNILKRIFDYQFSWSYKQNIKHNGIGLSIAKDLIEEELKGSIVASNDNGAIFTISLPLL